LTTLDISGNDIKQGETFEEITAIFSAKSIYINAGISFD
jgi:hypothetical protein